MSLEEDLKKEIDGTVEEMVIGGPSISKGIVIGDKVFEMRVGGPGTQIGYVKDGIAYEMVIGGPERILGRVNYNNQTK